MGPLEWIFVVETIVLAVAGICGATAYFSRPTHQDPDPFLRAMIGFWRTMSAKRVVFDSMSLKRSAVGGDDDDNITSDDGVTRPAGSANFTPRRANESAEPASPVLRGGAEPAAVATSSLSVRLVPQSATNEVLGRDGDTLHIAVSGTADDATANKLVMALIARELNLRPYQLSLVRGHFNASKMIRVSGLSPPQLRQILSQFPQV